MAPTVSPGKAWEAGGLLPHSWAGTGVMTGAPSFRALLSHPSLDMLQTSLAS